jgi:hypothetical protein
VIIDYGGWCGVVVEQHFDLGLGECHLSKDLVAGGGSGEQHGSGQYERLQVILGS